MPNKIFIVAEISANHNQNLNQAIKLVHAAKEAGADAVKLQTYTPDTMTIDCDRDEFRIKGTLWDGETLYQLYSKAYMPWEWQVELKKEADQIGIELFSTPFDKTAVDFLESIGVKRYKIASFEVPDIKLIRYTASKRKPLIISTGMANESEILDAMAAAVVSPDLTLLKCVSAYPAKPEMMNLNAIPYLAEVFGLPVGLSDHTLNIDVPVMAVCMGITVVEKHITLSRTIETPDRAFSLEPYEFKQMVDKIRLAEKVLGEKRIILTEKEKESLVFRRSLFAVQDIKQGELLTELNVRSIRPGNGLPPKYWPDILGKVASQDIKRGTPLKWEHISQSSKN